MLPSASIQKIAESFRPSHWNYHYAKSKLGTDPVYAAMESEIRGSQLPLLDLGCGLGLWSFYLRESGFTPPILALDYDSRKIAGAQRAAVKNWPDLSFFEGNVLEGLPSHAGNVTILDILQYLPPAERMEVLREAAKRVAPGGKLLIRAGVRDESWRYRLTFFADRFAKLIRWMKGSPIRFSSVEEISQTLESAGLTGTSRPLWGKTPFNNYLFVFSAPAVSTKTETRPS
jgi:SAM-dependent methyltransferase